MASKASQATKQAQATLEFESKARSLPSEGGMSEGRLEVAFDASFATELALREKQIQQNYRPVIGVHKWFARRPGTIFRSLLLAEYAEEPLRDSFWVRHELRGVIGDPFMGGGTPVYEANRLGFHVVACDINPMAYWIARQSLARLDIDRLLAEGRKVVQDVEGDLRDLYKTNCEKCGGKANVKYFLWVKTTECPHCKEPNDLFPGYRLAEAERHPKHVLACAECGSLNEYDDPPTRQHPASCSQCGHPVHIEGNVSRKKLTCRRCKRPFAIGTFDRPLEHRMWAIEYNCSRCYGEHPGRQFKKPDTADRSAFRRAEKALAARQSELPIPDDEILPGDESDRLHRWGYRKYHEMFNARQLLGLGILLQRIKSIHDPSIRDALLTVFSDTLRYQNMLCRYDTYALKCQDIFSVHGFPVGLIQCENSLLGTDAIGSGGFRHFVEKYARAKRYCEQPFETRHHRRRKEVVPIHGETIEADLVEDEPTNGERKQALLFNGPSQRVPVRRNSLDGVFTDPPYFNNVQYAELMDFCFVWLRRILGTEYPCFSKETTRSSDELTGNESMGRGIEHFTSGISEVFCHFTNALKPGRPFVFTYHHNDPAAYVPLVVAILDAGLVCTATLPAAAEMTASLHIARTESSILDSVFVCRKPLRGRSQTSRDGDLSRDVRLECGDALRVDVAAMERAGLSVSRGDLRCLAAGHIARIAIRTLQADWVHRAPLADRISLALARLEDIAQRVDVESTANDNGCTATRTRSS